MKPPPGSRRGRVVVLKLVTKSYFTTLEPFTSVCVEGRAIRDSHGSSTAGTTYSCRKLQTAP